MVPHSCMVIAIERGKTFRCAAVLAVDSPPVQFAYRLLGAHSQAGETHNTLSLLFLFL